MSTEFEIKGVKFTISDEDTDLLEHKWRQTVSNRGEESEMIYAGRNVYDNQKYSAFQLLHRVILSRMLERPLVKGECVDHIDRDSTNNQRENLRLATRTQNAANRKRRKDSTIGLKGVTHEPRGRKGYIAKIYVNKKNKYLGCFPTPEEAHAAYMKAARELFGEFARGE